MRVTRRTRPSQVGCGASIGRRRLLHTQASDTPPAPKSQDQAAMTGLTVVIQLDFLNARETRIDPAHRTRGDRLQTQAPVAAAASARGW